MRVLLTSEARFERTPDGRVWGGAAYGRAVWTRYLDVFSAVEIVARVSDVRDPSPGQVPASCEDVNFWRVPPYVGLSGLLGVLPQLRRRMASALDRPTAVLVRAPSPLAVLAARAASAARRRYAAEIVGDPAEVFSAGAFRHPLRWPLRAVATASQKRLARHAAAVLYVTRDVLQQRYPTSGCAYCASDVALDDAAFRPAGRLRERCTASFTVVTVGALDQPYKGTAVLLNAVSRLRRAGAQVRLRIVGDGRLLPALRGACDSLDLVNQVEFLGQQDRDGVHIALDSADLFVLPSFTEGLPRALLEAMARGLAAVATNVGGVPELLPRECLVPPRDASALASAIARLMNDDSERQRLGERNLIEARRYHDNIQVATRRAFLRHVRAASGGEELAEVRCA